VPSESKQRRGVVAVICRQQRLLVIRRADHVEAPGTYCFPGGAIEPGESPQNALRRELLEELRTEVRPVRVLWESVTAWQVQLQWWLATLEHDLPLRPNPDEVAECAWLTAGEIGQLPTLLTSNHRFLAAWRAGRLQIDGYPPP
jgi:(d)CTP diphosphatase